MTYPPDVNVRAARIMRALCDLFIAETFEAEAPLTRLADARLHAGRKEQDGSTSDWSSWTGTRFGLEAIEEAVDLRNYIAEALARGHEEELLASLGLSGWRP